VNALRHRYAWVIAGLVAAAVLTQGLVQAGFAYRSGLHQVRQAQEYEARLAAIYIDQYAQRLQRSAQWLADFLRGDADFDWTRLRTEAHIVLRQEPAVQRIVVLQRDGACLLVSRVAADQRLDCKLELPESLRTALNGKDAVRLLDGSGELPLAAVLARVHDDGPWLVLAEVNLAFAWDVVSAIAPPGQGTAAVLDTTGRLIAHRDIAEVATGHVVPAAERVDGAFEIAALPQIDGQHERVVRATQQVPGLGWSVVVESPVSVLLNPVLDELARTLGVSLAWGLAAIVVGVVLARRLASPVHRLEQAVRAFGAGERDRRSDLVRNDELGSLATSFNRMADEIQSYTGQLESRVNEKTRELAQANEHKSQFLANVSHELRTPLNAIIGYSEALKEDIFGALSPKQRECADDIHSSGLHLLALINDLLDLSKVEAGRIDLDLAPFDVREFVERSLGVLRERAASGGVELRADIGTEVGTWTGDELRLRQSVMNLLSNAVKFTRPGGTVTLSVRQTAGQLQIAVADTGVGIPEDQLPRLFERFSRIQNAATAGFSAPKGTGLGLALTRSFVELHGGRITVASRVGEGSTFTIVLPAMTQARDADKDADKDADGNGAGG
jgi:signal transduction histidine kinase